MPERRRSRSRERVRRRSRSREKDHRVPDRRFGGHGRGRPNRARRDERRGSRNSRRRGDGDRDRRRRSRSRGKDDGPTTEFGAAVADDDDDDAEYRRRLEEQLAQQEEEEKSPEQLRLEARKRREELKKRLEREKKAVAMETTPVEKSSSVSDKEQCAPSSPAGTPAAVPMSVDATVPSSAAVPSLPSIPFSTAPSSAAAAGVLPTAAAAPPAEEEEEFDMFGDDSVPLPTDQNDAEKFERNVDDEEGYLQHRIGQRLDDRYEVKGQVGKGAFGTVLKCYDMVKKCDVAVKILRNDAHVFGKSGRTEVEVLKRLGKLDPEGTRHCVMMNDTFTYREHFCVTFDLLECNLKEHLKKNGKSGFSLKLVRLYARQLLSALSFLRELDIIHADIKPDNVLVRSSRRLELADFGSTFPSAQGTTSPLLVAMFYRAPEIILGIKHTFALDVWAMGCTIYEMFTNVVLFQGTSPNNMLRLHQETMGGLSKKMLKRGDWSGEYFAPDGVFVGMISETVSKRMVFNASPIKPISDLIPVQNFMDLEERRLLLSFQSLLRDMLALDPLKRAPAQQALSHEFFSV